jgi:DNA-binding beta-propeller fold protein YncE
MTQRTTGWGGLALGTAALLAACGGGGDAGGGAGSADTTAAAAERAPTAAIALTVDSLEAPEAARFDPELEVYFVANINGRPLDKDGNGYISRLTRDGEVDSLKFIAGGRGGATLNAPKGMAIKGDTLWVTDIDAARAFDKRTGKPITSVSLPDARFLNDAVVGPDGAIYLTDSGGEKAPGTHRVFRIENRKATVALTFADEPGPNGITWDSAGSRFVIVSFGAKSIFKWGPGDTAVDVITDGPGMMDGVEPLGDGRLLITSWVDSSLFVLEADRITKLLGGLPGPADIGLDRERRRVAVPSLTDNRLEFVDLPE